MSARTVLTVLLSVVAVPAIAVADGLPPHSSYYAEHHHYAGKGSNVEVVVNRSTNRATIYASDNCLGTQGGYTQQATVRGAVVRDGKLHYDGKANVYSQTGTMKVTLKLVATVTSQRVTGTVNFPDTSGCSRRSFTAGLVSKTK
jgi:hypothetical protein